MSYYFTRARMKSKGGVLLVTVIIGGLKSRCLFANEMSPNHNSL